MKSYWWIPVLVVIGCVLFAMRSIVEHSSREPVVMAVDAGAQPPPSAFAPPVVTAPAAPDASVVAPAPIAARTPTPKAKAKAAPAGKPVRRSPEAWQVVEDHLLRQYFGANTTKAGQILQDTCETIGGIADDYAKKALEDVRDGGTMNMDEYHAALEAHSDAVQDALVELRKLGRFSNKELSVLMKDPEFGNACPTLHPRSPNSFKKLEEDKK